MRALIALAAAAFCACGPASQAGDIPEYGYEIVHSYPHDSTAFTQGLFFLDGALYEGTGMESRSGVRKVALETGEVLKSRPIGDAYFGEGIVNWKDKLLELTWRHGVGFIYGLGSFEPKGEFRYNGEGWGLTQDGKRIIMSDGTAELRFLDPETLQETGRLKVTANSLPVTQLNELEWVEGEIWANIWQTDRIARIDPKSGWVKGWINCAGLLAGVPRTGTEDVLNGIAYDARGKRIFVTGKNWPRLFEIKVVKR